MKTLILSMIAAASLNANAAIDCNTKIVSNGKTTESKIAMKEVKNDKDKTTHFEAERDGYIFQAEMNDPDPARTNGLTVIDKATKRRSVARYGGMKTEGLNTYFSAALVSEEGAKAKTGQLVCRFAKE